MEQHYEKLLNIKTSGNQKKFYDSNHYHRYEPTSYELLDLLFKNYPLNQEDSLVDFGCGKGRLNFYINYLCNCKVTGIEMNYYYYNEALENRTHFYKKHKHFSQNIQFVNTFAEEYSVNSTDTVFYFFNPFSIQIFTKVIENILISLENYPRSISLILYYPSDDYIYFLENNTAFQLTKEIINHNNINDSRDRFLIFSLSYI